MQPGRSTLGVVSTEHRCVDDMFDVGGVFAHYFSVYSVLVRVQSCKIIPWLFRVADKPQRTFFRLLIVMSGRMVKTLRLERDFRHLKKIFV
ncbi:unnamed protein product [Gongylonema pulchrum]|uniref:Uncharacterized protein n=1 Tax=Gongylonema pulchrum TaxID=637853 RepID=A0A183CXK6_9BILA|nr:unnamed protein product [Gongylonema pulchrum]